MKTPFAALAFLACASCAAGSGSVPVVDMKFLETPENAPSRERASGKFPLTVALVRGARLTYARVGEILKAAETPAGGSPQLLLRASRSLAPGAGVVLLGTARSLESGSSSGSATDLAIYQLALQCDPSDVDAPGELRNCAGYFLRVGKVWPAEVYEVEKPTVTLIPEGGTARGRARVKSKPAGFAAELDGEFVATMLEIGAVAPTAEAGPKAP